MAQTAGGSGQARGFLTPGGPITDNIAFLEWCEQSRKILHGGALELGICAAEVDARLRKVSRGLMVGGMTSGYRSGRVAKPIASAAEALVVASRYIITASNRFEAGYAPELEAAGFHGRGNPGFTFRGN